MTYIFAYIFILILNLIVPVFVLTTIALTVYFVVLMVTYFFDLIAIQFFEGEGNFYLSPIVPIISILLTLGIASKYNVWNLFAPVFEVF